MVPISRCVPGDSTFHVNGALVVAPERALQHAVDQLKRIADEFPDSDLFIISPITRFISVPCCKNSGHVTNFGEPDYLSNLISDLTKLKFQLRKKLQSAMIIDGIELICGDGCGREKVEQILRAGWAHDPVHPSGHINAKMALNLIEKVAAPTLKQNPKKRKRSDDTASGSGSGPTDGNQRGPSAQQFHHNRQSGQPRDTSRDRNREDGSASQQFGGGYGSGYGSSRQVSYPPSVYNSSRGRAGSTSSRGTSGSSPTGAGTTRGTAAASATEARREAGTGRDGESPPDPSYQLVPPTPTSCISTHGVGVKEALVNFEGLSQEGGQVKLAENLRASLFILSNDITFGQIYIISKGSTTFYLE
jgi:hypothetical protein